MTKTQLTERCRYILSKYPIDFPINDNEDLEFLYSLFENHAEWDLKKGIGIQSISVINAKFNTLCFQLRRIDNSTTDISFTKCITHPSKISQVKKACRSAIRNEVVEFRKKNVIFGITKCPFTDEILFPLNTHIDHYDLTFDEAFLEWGKNKPINDLFNLINKTKDNCFETYFTDNNVVEDFINFHNSNCKLRAVSKFANLSILK